MDKKNIQSILQDVLEEEIPSSDINLWRTVQASLVTGRNIKQGEKLKTTQPRRIPRTAFALLVIVALLTIAFITPQGRAFAQSILRFFVRIESNTRPVPTLAPVVTLVNPNTSNTISSDPSLEKHLPFEDTCGDILLPHCSLQEIRMMVNFPIQGLEIALDGIGFVGATGGPEQVTLIYAGEGLNGTLSLFEEPANPDKQPWQVASGTTVESVSVGGAAGEYVQGGWFSTDADDGVAWNADASVQTLRWESDGILYTIIFRAGKMSMGILLDKPAMLDLAVHFSPEIAASLEPTPSLGIEQISQMAGFEVIEPNWVPEGYVFLDAAYTPERNAVCLLYTSHGGDNLPLLAIVERPGVASSILDDITIKTVDIHGQQITIPIVTEPLTVGGASDGQAVLISNGVNADALCPYKNFTANQALYWQANGKSFIIFGLLDQYEGGVFVSRLEMQRLAEGLTGVMAIPNDKLDPERLLSIEDADALATFDVKAPTQMVAGVQFDHAVFVDGDQTQDVRLVYTLGAPTRGGIDYGFFVTQATGAIRTLEEIYLWGGYEHISMNGLPALYRMMCWDVTGGGTDCYQEMSWDENGVGYDIKAYFPGALEKEEFLTIAESMR